MRLRLVPTTHAPSEARRTLDPFEDTVDRASLADLRSVVSELVAFSVLHGESRPIDLCVELSDGEIEGRLDDHGPGALAMVRAKENKVDSLVLQIVEGLVSEWQATTAGISFRMVVQRPS